MFMFPLDDQDLAHLAPEGWLRIGSLIAIAPDLLGRFTGVLPRGIAAKVLAVLKPGEAMARRLLFLIVRSASPANAGASCHPVPHPAQNPAKPRVPQFRFTEPLGTGPRPRADGPRICFFNEPPKPPRPTPAPPTSAPLLARVAALQDVITNPDRHAKRFARCLARRRAANHARPVPFNFLKVPGLARKRLQPMLREDVLFFNDAAFYKAMPPPNTG